MIRGKVEIIKWIRANECPYWKIFGTTGSGKNGNYIFASEQERENLSLEGSIEKFSECLDSLSTGKYIVVCKRKPSDTKSLAEVPYEHENANAPIYQQNNQQQNNAVGNSGGLDFESRLKMELDKLRNEWKITELEKQLTEAKKELAESSGSWDRVLKRVDPYIDPALNHFFPVEKKTTISAVGFSNNNQTTDKQNISMSDVKYSAPLVKVDSPEEASERCKIALEKWQEADEDYFLYVIEKIAHTAVNDPATYQMYRAMLLK